jgi:hypothetical protein
MPHAPPAEKRPSVISLTSSRFWLPINAPVGASIWHARVALSLW